VRITAVRATVAGTPWRDLVVELETDTGPVGVGEVRPVNKTDSFVAVVEELAGRFVARGYRAMKLDPFAAASVRLSAADRRRALAVVAAVREAVGPDIDLMIEMHGRFSPDTAAQVAVALEPFAPRWIEEPVPPEQVGRRPDAGHDACARHPRTGARLQLFVEGWQKREGS
jgi:L-alanine-DL-glutamate epimerase-like enolase superfamily enzyme